MGQERRHFTDEFKTEAIALLASSGRPLIQIANELGISPSMLRNWRNRQGGQNAGSAVPPKPAPTASNFHHLRGRYRAFSTTAVLRSTPIPSSVR